MGLKVGRKDGQLGVVVAKDKPGHHTLRIGTRGSEVLSMVTRLVNIASRLIYYCC